MKTAFAWTPVFETGLLQVDQQHRRLVDMVNQIIASDSTGADGTLKVTLLDDLIAYAAQHFQDEERLMVEHGLATDGVALHVAEHRAFVGDVLALRGDAGADGDGLHELQRFLASWLAFHILGTDQVMAAQIRLVAAGASPQQARERAAGERSAAAVQPLLDALSTMYSVLAGRKAALETKVAVRTAELESERNELASVLKKMERSQSQLLQSEKMAAIGQLAAGVAHEINNPVGFVSSNLGTLKTYVQQLLEVIDAHGAVRADPGNTAAQARLAQAVAKADLDYLREDIVALLQESHDGLGRVRRIVSDLKDFSHVDEAQWQQADLNAGLESTLNVVWSEIKYKADVVRHLGELPAVPCIAAQINQVFMNLLVNAAQAIEQRGTITLSSRVEGEQAVVEIADTGKGIAPEVLGRIFEPFFTTKPVGKGTGLGLSIAWDIVKKHNGQLGVRSTPGEGTCFELRLPLVRPDEPAGAPRA
jgi:hemerythrin-like metal-binding protein